MSDKETQHTIAYQVLLFIERNGSATSFDVQKFLSCSQPYASNTLRRLYAWHKVSRVPFHLTNNRGFKYELTKKGRETASWLHKQER